MKAEKSERGGESEGKEMSRRNKHREKELERPERALPAGSDVREKEMQRRRTNLAKMQKENGWVRKRK